MSIGFPFSWLARRVYAVAVVVAVAGCSGHAQRLVIHVRGESTTVPGPPRCFLNIRQRIVGGGTTTYCLERYSGRPEPNATLRDSGVLTIALREETIRVRVHVVARFGPDGRRARQSLTGRGISGGGPYVEDPPGHVASSNFRYVISR